MPKAHSTDDDARHDLQRNFQLIADQAGVHRPGAAAGDKSGNSRGS